MTHRAESEQACTLRPPETPQEWERYRHIRRTVVLETRGECEGDDPDRSEAAAAGDHPLLLFRGGEAVGAIRIEVRGPLALFRHVAVRPPSAARDDASAMLALAEEFVRSKGCARILTNVGAGAVALYERCGFTRSPASRDPAPMLVMQKLVGTR